MRDSNECNPVECCLEMCCQILVYPLLDAALNCCAEECQKCCDDAKEVEADEYSLITKQNAPSSPIMNRNGFLNNSTNQSEKESIVATTSGVAQPHQT